MLAFPANQKPVNKQGAILKHITCAKISNYVFFKNSNYEPTYSNIINLAAVDGVD